MERERGRKGGSVEGSNSGSGTCGNKGDIENSALVACFCFCLLRPGLPGSPGQLQIHHPFASASEHWHHRCTPAWVVCSVFPVSRCLPMLTLSAAKIHLVLLEKDPLFWGPVDQVGEFPSEARQNCVLEFLWL